MIRTCSGCGATWLDGQLYWATGKMACPHDLAGLVCNDVKYPHCKSMCRIYKWYDLEQERNVYGRVGRDRYV